MAPTAEPANIAYFVTEYGYLRALMALNYRSGSCLVDADISVGAERNPCLCGLWQPTLCVRYIITMCIHVSVTANQDRDTFTQDAQITRKRGPGSMDHLEAMCDMVPILNISCDWAKGTTDQYDMRPATVVRGTSRSWSLVLTRWYSLS